MHSRILIVEDDDIVRGVMKKKLESCGYQVVAASNGKTGMDTARNHRCHLVITDILMPESDGLEILMFLKREQPEVKSIAITAAGNELHLENARRFGASRTLVKPFRLDELASTVNELLGDPPSGGVH